MRKFDTKVQELKYRVLKEIARYAWNGKVIDHLFEIPKVIVPGTVPTMRCCVYKERAIVQERIKLAMGGDRNNPNVMEVLEIACEECPMGGYEVTNACQGCLAHHCGETCRFGAISYDQNHVAHIDKSKCKECGMCSKACPYTAIISRKRPCQNSCKVKAITMNEDGSAKIDNNKCISCGACAYMCPFGAIGDKSYIMDVIDMLKRSQDNTKYQMIAIVAPAISSQFTYVKTGQVISAIKELGFAEVYEAALGADMVALSEAKELTEKGFLTSSCCPAFVNFIEKNYPDLVPMISHNLSPMAALGKFLKEDAGKNCRIVFIGPCTAKKMEIQKEKVRPYIDVVMTFEELQAMIDSRDIDMSQLPEQMLDNASYFGRVFGRTGGLTEAVVQSMKEQGLDQSFETKPIVCSGIEECKLALLKKKSGKLDANFIEGMACMGGCVGGAGNLMHAEKNRLSVDKYGKDAGDATITEKVNNAK